MLEVVSRSILQTSSLELEVDGRVGSLSEVAGRESQGVIHLHDRLPQPDYSGPASEGFFQRLTQGQSYVFDRVVTEVALSPHLDINQSVGREGIYHMIQKPYPGPDVALPVPVQLD